MYVRTGIGQGHEHMDTLDLQVFAHGLPMTVDDGQRSGYAASSKAPPQAPHLFSVAVSPCARLLQGSLPSQFPDVYD